MNPKVKAAVREWTWRCRLRVQTRGSVRLLLDDFVCFPQPSRPACLDGRAHHEFVHYPRSTLLLSLFHSNIHANIIESSIVF